tara:strand:+ start:65446 stop:65781 length:336 start_codon:yes stop_codon:yes gene_type:complete
MTNGTTLTERQQYWLKHIRACEAAGQTSIDYARAHDISVKSLYSARKELASKGRLLRSQSTVFQKAQVVNNPRSLESQWQVQLPNGAVVAFSGAVDAAILSLVLNTAAVLS